MSLQDADVREQAISPNHSYIIQAPAGSGKTELLTRRFLKLLLTVQAPEQIIALTFTRKAASEMRTRILTTLESCQEIPDNAPSYQQALKQDALLVLERERELNWQLLSQPQRLKVMTLDAMCQSLVRVLPIESPVAGNADIEMLAERLYKQAAQACFNHALATPSLQGYLLSLLRHLDNRQDRLIELWVNLLQTRDQWLPVVYQAHGQSKQEVETALLHLQAQAVQRLIEAIPQKLGESLRDFCLRLASVLPDLPQYQCFKNWQQFTSLSIEEAKALASLLLTSDNKIRKRADHHVGLKRESCAPHLYKELKAESEAIFEALNQGGLAEALLLITILPSPYYEEGKWVILQALLSLLPMLVAHLKIIFETHNRVDFTEVALSATEVLGKDTAPSDLALHLDYTIQHLLIDEFQDTSLTQFALIQQLIMGWQKGDGRTLFIVGDPMQSIYRFRQAEVGLFLKVKEEGIGTFSLTPLYLSSNFRSVSPLIEWVNQHAAGFFPFEDEIELGAVRFHPAVAVNETADDNAVVKAVQTRDAQHEASVIAGWIKDLLGSSQLSRSSSGFSGDEEKNDWENLPQNNETIAILVRSRAQLESIIPMLEAQQIPYEGVDLFSISNLLPMRDLLSLTQALLMPHERLPWLCVLRSPYVGLTLSDLHAIALHIPKGSIYEGLLALQGSQVSEEGKQRLLFFKEVVTRAYEVQDQYLLSDWIFLVHQQLHGSVHTQDYAWQNFEKFFSLVAQLTVNNKIQDWDLFTRALKRMFASEEAVSPVKIMTIHQAKGLEFDTVILPGLSKSSRVADQTLLKWMRVLQAHGKAPLWLLSPLKAAEELHDELYDYLRFLENQKEHYELQRLLYVALTRAKKRLYLCDIESKRTNGSFRALLTQQSFEQANITHAFPTTEKSGVMSLFRLPLMHYGQPPVDLLIKGNEAGGLPYFSSAKKLGVIIHRWVQWICENQVRDFSGLPWRAIEQDLRQHGIVGEEAINARVQIETQLKTLLNTQIGQWLIHPHPKARNEYAFTVCEPGKKASYIVDRLFFCAPYFWIVDFKTGEDESLEHVKHRQQVERYAHYLKSELAAPIQVGLYYLSSGRWVTWTPS